MMLDTNACFHLVMTVKNITNVQQLEVGNHGVMTLEHTISGIIAPIATVNIDELLQ